MILIDNFNQVIAQIKSERGISKEEIIDALKLALTAACKKIVKQDLNYEVIIDEITGETYIYKVLTIVKEIEDENLEITLKDAKKESIHAQLDQTIRIDITPENFGRIAALTAKQVIMQRIREAEKNSIYEEFQDKIGKIIIGTIQKIEAGNYLVNLGRTESTLTKKEQIAEESFHVKDKVKVYIPEIQQTSRGARIVISRAHPGFLKKLLEQEIPEIQDGIIEIKSVSREPGQRAKVAVHSNNSNVGAVGTCVGHMGGRIQGVIKELNYEKIDILEWNEDPRVFIGNALKPAKVNQVLITNEEERTAAVIVPNDQLSLAIGKRGVNVRLTVKLTNWKLDIYSEEEFHQNKDNLKESTQATFVDRVKKTSMELKVSEPAPKTQEEAKNTAPSSEEKEPVKVSVLSKELKIKTAELIKFAEEIGITIKSNRSTVSETDINNIRNAIKTTER